jgi:uncharacterized protein with HEPN domain
MVQRRVEPVLVEILAAIDGIVAATKGKTIDDFRNEWLLRHGVERGIEIISEAARHLPESYAARTSEIPWKEIRGIGNVLRHEYHKSSDAIVWAVVTNHLPPPRSAVLRLMSEN